MTTDEVIGTATKTQRGFELIEFKDANGNECSIQQSSAVGHYDDSYDRPGTSFIWLGQEREGKHSVTGESLGARMHLNREQAKALATLLLRWARTGLLSD